MRDIINEFRKKKLRLRPVTYLSGSHSSPHDLPYGYIWSPHLVPKPKGLSISYINKQVISGLLMLQYVNSVQSYVSI